MAQNDYGQQEPGRFVARVFAAAGSPVFRYRFSYLPAARRAANPNGAPHAAELSFVFGTLDSQYGSDAQTPQDAAVSRMMRTYWANFAKTGDPNGEGLPRWPRYEATSDALLDFRPDGSAAGSGDAWKSRLDVTEAASEAGVRNVL
jgi:para-nitrobenzyl esterase